MLHPNLSCVLICGSRNWRWPRTVHAVCDRLTLRYGELIFVEGHARGADIAVHSWCDQRGVPDERRRCYPVDWAAERRRRPASFHVAGHERNSRMLRETQPDLIIALHATFDYARGGTSDMALRGLLAGVPAWLIPGPDPNVGRWLSLKEFPAKRIERILTEPVTAG